jgi:hypothetical protein
MSKVYIAGPMRGYPQFNFPAFDKAAALGRSLGWEVISPAEMDRASGFQETVMPASFEPAAIREFIRRDVNVLVNILRAEDGDAIALLPGWQKSTGARSELALAVWGKLMVVDALTFIPLNVEIVGVEHRPVLPAAFRECVGGSCDPFVSTMQHQMQELADSK